MNNKKIYIILVVSLVLNLFFLGFMTGRIFHSSDEGYRPFPGHGRFLPPPPFARHAGIGYGVPHHPPFPGQIAPRPHMGMMPYEGGPFHNMDKKRFPDMRPPYHKGFHGPHHGSRFPEKYHRGAFKGILCGKVDEDVRKLEREMIEKGKPFFEKQMRENKEIRAALRREFAKETLDTAKIKELFTKQAEGFINIQKNAQDALLEMVSKLPADKRSELVCTADRDDPSDKIRPERHHDGKPKDIRRRGH